MPSLTFLGCQLFLAEDDVALLAPLSMLLCVLWLVADTCWPIAFGLHELGVPPELLIADLAVNAASIPASLALFVFSAHGRIMQPRRFPVAFQVAVLLRVALALLSIATSLALTLSALVPALASAMPQLSLAPMAFQGLWWGELTEGLSYQWSTLAAILYLILRWAVIYLAMTFILLISVPGLMGIRTIEWTLAAFGVGNHLIAAITEVMMSAIGKQTMTAVAPTDLTFGLMLVQARQGQGFLVDAEDFGGRQACCAESADEAEDILPQTTVRGCRLPTNEAAPRPFSRANQEDLAALNDIVRLEPYASGIYGVVIHLSSNSVYPGTSLPRPCGPCSSVLRTLPCCEPTQGGEDWEEEPVTEGDLCCALNQRTFRRNLHDAYKCFGETEPELLWATWKNRGPATSPPLAVLLDHAFQRVVVTIRGTMDFKDCISDLVASPAFFDPFGVALPEDRRSPPFDNETGLFAHQAVLLSAYDALARLEEANVLARAYGPAGRASGWPLVVTGHSLGAGVGCLLALMLRRDPRYTDVRFVGFEPPGGLLSKRLAKATQELGWVSAVCSYDWVPRLTMRSVQAIRKQALQELAACKRSKLQLALLQLGGLISHSGLLCCCLRSPLAGLLEWLGGGRLAFTSAGGSVTFADESDPEVPIPGSPDHWLTPCGGAEDDAQVPELWPPGLIAYFRPVHSEPWLCGYYMRDLEWVVEWIHPAHLSEIVLSLRAVELHFPNIIQHAYRQAARALGLAHDVVESDSELEASRS
ncbi:unnamed protein product [Polarella glacialis]|uniref:sn-1-specific diacylglycerol lipase n=1 Tax=Polarella glacialis TaxID=89957 RepID=A0A813GKG2_POLGL|nr:unnamed protein product [Polarella glacialis]CAE8719509.1 unnamed protein product [Polarella glacialis]